MSISSVGGSFGYIDPATVAGPTASVPPQTSNDTDPPSKPGDAADMGTPLSPPAAPSPSPSIAKFSTDASATLLQIQEKASTTA